LRMQALQDIDFLKTERGRPDGASIQCGVKPARVPVLTLSS
jgi:hypothetical protein